MSADEAPSPDRFPGDVVANLRLRVREASRSGRWIWEIIDIRDDTLIERELEFESATDARRSGLARLAELTPGLSRAKMPGKTAGTPGRRLVVVSRNDLDLYEEFRRLLGDIPEIELVRDRRRAERRHGGDRRVSPGPPAESVERRRHIRRRGERRSRSVDPNLRLRGWCVVLWAERQRASA